MSSAEDRSKFSKKKKKWKIQIFIAIFEISMQEKYIQMKTNKPGPKSNQKSSIGSVVFCNNSCDLNKIIIISHFCTLTWSQSGKH